MIVFVHACMDNENDKNSVTHWHCHHGKKKKNEESGACMYILVYIDSTLLFSCWDEWYFTLDLKTNVTDATINMVESPFTPSLVKCHPRFYLVD